MQTENDNQPNQYLDMSDDEIVNMSAPTPVIETPAATGGDDPEAAAAAQAEADRVAAEAEAKRVADEEAAAAAAKTDDAGQGGEGALAQADDKVTPPAPPVVTDDKATGKVDEQTPPAGTGDAGASAKTDGEGAPAAAKTDDEGSKEPTPEEIKSLYDTLLGKPIRANGRDIQLKTTDEVVRAVQMGLNYTKKMQAMQPHLRVVKMLENNKLGEADLSYLIDLHQKKPEAIQKLLHDSQFDPHTVDADKAASYVPGAHQVSDNEIALDAALDEVEATDTGPELILEVSKQWDAGSRQALFQDPRLLVEINKQKASGLYARISEEVQRRQALGELQGVPFIAAYHVVGKELVAKGPQAPTQQAELPKQPPAPVATRVVAPAPAVDNNDRARAASPTKQTPATVKVETNYLEESDEAFLKRMQGRV